MNRLRRWVQRHPRLRAILRNLHLRFSAEAASTALIPLQGEAAGSTALALRDAWQDSAIPERQRRLVDPELASYRAGQAVPAFDVLVDMLRSVGYDEIPATLLEIGCSSGHYAEVMQIKRLPVRYTGCDYSNAFIDLARSRLPDLQFDVEDATALGYNDEAFDVVVSGCCLLHIPQYRQAIAETARVTRRLAIFHRTPVLHRQPTRIFTKKAYDVQTVEIHFNEQELVREFAAQGLRVIDIATITSDWRDGDAMAVKTYLCEKAHVEPSRRPVSDSRGIP